MKPIWLRDELIRLLYEDSDIVAIDKPYGFDSHTNESKAGRDQAAFIVPGLIELFEKQLERELHIVHRLDRTTTGVLVFAKTEAAAKTYRDFFRERKVKKTYTFVTSADASTKKDFSQFSCEKPIVRNGAELDAKTDFRFADGGSGFARWDAFPRTGRNHQIRIHAAESGLPILGDTKYGGELFPFLCLHNRKIEFTNGVVIESPLPRYFEQMELLKDAELSRWLQEVDRRDRLFGPKASVRLFHGHRTKNRDERGLSLDRWGDRVILNWPRESVSQAEENFFWKLSRALDEKIDIRVTTASVEGASRWVYQEGQVRFELREGVAATIGLEANQRLQRSFVYQTSKGAACLNLFAYAGAMSVVAMKGGATDVVTMNTSKSLMEWAKANFALNGLDWPKAKFLLRDPLTFLEKAKAKKQSFDFVICDPPSFWRADKKVFKIENDLEKLLSACLSVLSENGKLLFSTTSEALFIDDIRKTILGAEKKLKKKRSIKIASIQPSLDFETPGEKPSLKSFLITSSL